LTLGFQTVIFENLPNRLQIICKKAEPPSYAQKMRLTRVRRKYDLLEILENKKENSGSAAKAS